MFNKIFGLLSLITLFIANNSSFGMDKNYDYDHIYKTIFNDFYIKIDKIPKIKDNFAEIKRDDIIYFSEDIKKLDKERKILHQKNKIFKQRELLENLNKSFKIRKNGDETIYYYNDKKIKKEHYKNFINEIKETEKNIENEDKKIETLDVGEKINKENIISLLEDNKMKYQPIFEKEEGLKALENFWEKEKLTYYYFKFCFFIEGFWKYKKICLFTSVLFQTFIPGLGGHNVYKNIGHNFYLYTSNFPSFTKFLRFGISYKINKMIHLNIFGFNIWKSAESIIAEIFLYSKIRNLNNFYIDPYKIMNEDTFFKNNLFWISFCLLRCFEISVEYNLAKYYCVRFDILSLIISIVYPLTLDKEIIKHINSKVNSKYSKIKT